MTRRQTALTALVLGILALGLRLSALGSSLTPDERLWSQRTTQFMQALDQQNWIGTLTSGHPGVTVMWAGTAGVVLKALIDPPPDAGGLPQLIAALVEEPSRADMIAWLRLPITLITLAAILVIALLARQLLGGPAAFLGAALLCFDPFLLAHSRVLQMDALLATFVSIAWLALLVATRTKHGRYFVVCGVAAALGFLTKASALALGPPVLAWILWQHWRSQPARPRDHRLGPTLATSLVDLLWIGIPALLTVWLAWPALWTAPVDTLLHVWKFATAIGGADHELGNFWLGKPVGSPGALFYPAVLLWRTTAISLVGLLLAGLALIWPAWRNLRIRRSHTHPASSSAPIDPAQITRDTERQAAWALFGFAIWFALVMSLGAKAFDRYLLPIFPIVDLLAAWGWIRAIRWVIQRTAGSATHPSSIARPMLFALAGILVVSQAAFAVTNRPTYLTAYNPLLGGLRTAQRVMLVGWGEGLEEAGAYLNQQPDASTRRVAAWYGSNVFGPFFRGRSFDLHYDLRTAADLYANDVDYVVTYINQLQRQLLDASIAAQLAAPVMESVRSGVPLAQVYAWPKPFDHTSDRAIADGLLLLGWELGPVDPDKHQVPVRLYWDADAAAGGGIPPVLVWLKDASGEVWAKTEMIPTVAPALLTPGWADHQAVLQALTLQLPAGLLAGDYRVEMAPEAASSLDLGSVPIPASPYDQTAPQDMRTPEPIVFGNSVQLVGSDLAVQGNIWQLDLLWAAVESPPNKAKFFVHGIDSAGEIVAQVDNVLAALPGQEIADWHQGDLVRQRVRIEWPKDTGEQRSLYLGIYDPDTGQRLPVMAGGQILPDGRYPLDK